MKVAVLIPLYNHARYIGAALESLRVQTRQPDRIIIIDDGSTDGSLNAVIKYSESLPPVAGDPADTANARARTDVITQANIGAHATINRAIALADDCDYLTILNSDDCYHPRRIERCAQYLDANPQVDLVCSRLRLIDEDGRSLPSDAPRARWFSAAWSFRPACDDQSALDLAEWLGLANFPGTTSNFFARAAYLRAHPLRNYRFAHDYYALIVAALENRLGVLDAELLDYRVHAKNTISTEPEQLIREMLRVNVDLARELGPRLGADPDLRLAFTRYQRAAWSNVSAFRADLFNLLTIEALALVPSQVADALMAGLTIERFPELGQFPNRALVNTHDPATPTLGPTSGLADKFYALKAQLSAARGSQQPWTEYRQLQAALLASRWFALGRLLGLTRRLDRAGGKTGAEKVAILTERLRNSFWLRLGRGLGVASAQKILASTNGSRPKP